MPRIVQLSDTHLFADPGQLFYGIPPNRHLEGVIRQVREHEQPDLVVVSGDLVHDETEQGYRHLGALLEGLACPVHCIPGNHDDPALMRRILTDGHVSCEPVVVLDDWLVILLDSFQAGKVSGRIDQSVLEWLSSQLMAHQDRHVLVFIHHPLLPCGCQWLDNGLLLEEPQALLDLVRTCGQVRAVLWGHSHQEFESVRDGVMFLGAPSTTIQFRKNSAEFALEHASRPGWRWLEAGEQGQLASGVCWLDI